MKLVIQRVSEASVTIEGKVVGSIGMGYVVLAGIGQDDTREEVDRLVKKMLTLRIFEDEQGKTNLSIQDVGGALLVISQFTLYADCRKGNRPSFINAAKPELAVPLYEYFVEQCRKVIPQVETGQFGADMKVALVNDGPFTICL